MPRLPERFASTLVRFTRRPVLDKCSPRPQGSTYLIVDVIGEGAYGVVVSAIHRPSNTKVAIKKIAPFDHSMFALRTLRELKLLKYFADQGVSENVSCRKTPR